MGMKYRDPNTGQLKELSLKAADTLPIGTIVDYDGEEVPEGWEEYGTDDYSTEEIFTGKHWIDGKPIYRKVVEHIVGQSWKDVEGISNIEHCFGVTGYFELNQDEEFIIPFTAAGGSSTIGLWFSVSKITHKLRQATNSEGYYNKKIILIVEYTKTTD